MPTIVHFEIPVDDMERAKKFYGSLFGWRIDKFSGQMEYWIISTCDENGKDAVKGGMVKREFPEHSVTNYIDVPSVDEYVIKIKNLGGEVIMPKTAVAGMGYFAVCLDTEKNSFGIWETDTSAK